MNEQSTENDAPNYVPWECPRCGKSALANLAALGPLGWVTCTCGTTSRPRVIPPEGTDR